MHRLELARLCVIYAASAVLAVCLVVEGVHRGGDLRAMPSTIEAHGHPGGNDTHRVILLCRQARAFIPRGATVTVIRPSQAPHYDATLFLAAVGNLPRHQVIAPHLEAESDDLPQYIIAVGERLADSRYELFAEFADGTVWVRK